MNKEQKEKEQKYVFWVGQIRYSGKIIKEDKEGYLIFDDRLETEVKLPKNITVAINSKENKEEDKNV